MKHLTTFTLVTALFASSLSAGEKAAGPDPAQLKKTMQAGINYLKSSQADDGSWTTPTAPGITGIAVAALLESGVPADDPTVKKALQFLEKHTQKDGGIYHPKSSHRNYETCISIMAFTAASKTATAEQKARYKKTVEKAEQFLRKLQWDEGEGLESSDPAYGGAGYGKHKRPDLSNTQFLLEALKAAGVKKDDPAMQKALLFVSRTQNLETEHNNTPFAAKVNDGGFYYTPAAGGTSQAGVTPNGGLRSYGSMTYAGLKSMVYAGLDAKDPRVKAAYKWLTKFYTLKENPGLGQQGRFYYYQTMAKTLSVLDKETIEGSDGKSHDWKAELMAELASLQKSNGSWVNAADRWYEGDPNLVTAYSLMSLGHCRP